MTASRQDETSVEIAALRPLLFTVYVPAAAYGIGMGAAAPVMALTAPDLGASSAVAGLTVALVGPGQAQWGSAHRPRKLGRSAPVH